MPVVGYVNNKEFAVEQRKIYIRLKIDLVFIIYVVKTILPYRMSAAFLNRSVALLNGGMTYTLRNVHFDSRC